MTKFKFDNCTSKQFIREKAWIPEAGERLKRMSLEAKLSKMPSVRRLRYLTFCAEGAIDVIALRNAKIIKRSKDKLYDTVVFFDVAPQAVDKTLSIIEGANGFPTDFFNLVNIEHDDVPNGALVNEMPRNKTEGDDTFVKEKNAALLSAFRQAFPFDLINLDVERYVIRKSEELPGDLLTAWDKLLEWQKSSRKHERKNYCLSQFTLFFTTKVGPYDLPEAHKSGLIDILEQNVAQFPLLKELMKGRFETETAAALYDLDFDSFLKLAIPKALISRALAKDWIPDPDLSYRAFVFDRTPPNSQKYTMVHYVLHFKRCQPSVATQINPYAFPPEIKAAYGVSVEKIFSTSFEDVDVLKIPIEAELRESLIKLGVPLEAL